VFTRTPAIEVEMPRKILRTKSIKRSLGNQQQGAEFFTTMIDTPVTESLGMLVHKVELFLTAEEVRALAGVTEFEFSISQGLEIDDRVQFIDDPGCFFSVQALVGPTTENLIFVLDAPVKGFMVVSKKIRVSVYVGVPAGPLPVLTGRYAIHFVDTVITAAERDLVYL
jgi:hypothetical protein